MIKISLYEQGFSKSESSNAILVTEVDLISLPVSSRRKFHAIYLDLSNAFHLIPYSLFFFISLVLQGFLVAM
jgi:hypothetical protein